MKSLQIFLMTVYLAGPVWAAGDAEYGEYLSSECVTCHRAKAIDAKIPTIHGMDEESFIGVMGLYRSKELENVTMQTVAKRLTDEDIAALAAFFAAQAEIKQ